MLKHGPSRLAYPHPYEATDAKTRPAFKQCGEAFITTKSSTRSESKLWRLVVTKFPETEKTHSLFAELAGIARTAFATPDRSGEGRKREKEV